MPATSHTRLLACLACLLAVLLTACSSEDEPDVDKARSDEPSTAPTRSPTSDSAVPLDSEDGSPDEPVALAPGRYVIPFIGASDDAPWAEIEVPAGWAHDRLHPATGPDLDPHLRRIELLTIASVAPDPCAWEQEPAGTSVTDLVRALEDVSLRSGPPASATIDGYSGRVLEFRVPADLDVTVCAHGGALVPFALAAGSHASVFPGWTYRVWVLGVDGHRLAVLAAHGPETTTEELAGLTAMIETLTFVEPVEA